MRVTGILRAGRRLFRAFQASDARSPWRGVFASAVGLKLRGFIAQLAPAECTRSPVRGCPCRRLSWQLSGFADRTQVAPNLIAFGEHCEQPHATLAGWAVQHIEVERPFQQLSPRPVRPSLWPLFRKRERRCNLHPCGFDRSGYGLPRWRRRRNLWAQLTAAASTPA
jgi:hypothetical protein